VAIDTRELAERDRRIRARADAAVDQPKPSERRLAVVGFLHCVIRSIPAADAPYVMAQQVTRAADHATTGNMQHVPDTLRPVLCEPNTVAGDYDQPWWVDETPEGQWNASAVVHLCYWSAGALWIMHKGRMEMINLDGVEYGVTDCYLLGAT